MVHAAIGVQETQKQQSTGFPVKKLQMQHVTELLNVSTTAKKKTLLFDFKE